MGGGYIRSGGSGAVSAGTVTVTSTGPSGAQSVGGILANLGNLTSGAFRFLDDATIATGQVKLNAGGSQLLAATALSGGSSIAYAVYQAKTGTTTSAAATGNIAIAAVVSVPVNSVPPSISGTAAAGATLTVVQGTYSGSPTSYAYQWYRGSTAISGATATTYQAVSADVGSTIKVLETPSNSAGAGAGVFSAATAVVAAAPILWFNCRSTQGYITDAANEDYYLGEIYPVTRNGMTIGNTNGVSATPSGTPFPNSNRSTSRGTHLAGYITVASGNAMIRIDLPQAGRWRFRTALGNGVGVTTQTQLLRNAAGILVTVPSTSTGASQACVDATGVAGDATTWASNQTANYVEFVTTTPAIWLSSNGAAFNQAAFGFQYVGAS